MGLRHFFLCVLLLLAAAPASAAASGWFTLGGGPARAGHDAFDHGATTPVIYSWSQTEIAEQDVQAGPVVSEGIPGSERVVYGTDDGSGPGNVHVQMLSTGMEVGPQEGYDIDDDVFDDLDTFGVVDAVVSPVIASSPSAPGQVYALHNDDNQGGGTSDIALAQIDLATGARVQDVPVPVPDGYEVQSSPVLTEPDAGGDASLFFLASNGGLPRLFRLDIADVQTASAGFAANSTSTPTNANREASPALVYLRAADGTPTQYVALGGAISTPLETYAVSGFALGPQWVGVGPAETPSVPLTSDGLLPGAPGSGMETSPYIYIATVPSSFTEVHRLEQNGNSQLLDATSSPTTLNGEAAHALAVSKRVGGDPAEGVVAVTTNQDLYLLEPGDLSVRAEYNPAPVASDFGSTVAALSDDLVFAMLANGTQKVLRTSNATEVSATEFTEHPANASPGPAKGQPALGGGRVIFPSHNGVFAYTTRDGTPPRVGNLGPPSVLGGGILEAVAADARGIRDVQFLVDGTPVASSTNPVSGLSHTPSGGRFIAGWDAGGTAPGEHTLQAVATDNGGQVSTAKAIIVVEPHTFADTDPPETTIEAGPRGRTADTTPRFRFSSSEQPEAFQCSLDGKRFRSCPTRHELALVAGGHRLRVRAIDAAGNVDPSPSSRSFTVLAPGSVEVAAIRPIELDRRGRVAVPVTCHSRRRCRGLLVVYAIVPRAGAGSVRAAPSRKGRKLRVGLRRFSVGGRTRRKVLVRVSAAGRRLLRRNGRVKALAKVKLNTPTGLERSSWPLTLTDKDG